MIRLIGFGPPLHRCGPNRSEPGELYRAAAGARAQYNRLALIKAKARRPSATRLPERRPKPPVLGHHKRRNGPRCRATKLPAPPPANPDGPRRADLNGRRRPGRRPPYTSTSRRHCRGPMRAGRYRARIWRAAGGPACQSREWPEGSARRAEDDRRPASFLFMSPADSHALHPAAGRRQTHGRRVADSRRHTQSMAHREGARAVLASFRRAGAACRPRLPATHAAPVSPLQICEGSFASCQ